MRSARARGWRRSRSASAASRVRMMPACGPPSSLSPEKQTTPAPRASRPGAKTSSGRPRRERSISVPLPRSSASGRPRCSASAGELGELGLGHEAPEGEIAAVHLEQQRGVRVDRGLVVAQMGAVGRADLDQAHARRRHDLGHPERAADLDQLAARHDRGPPLREPREHEQHRGGVVVDDQRARRAREQAQLVLHRRAARAALAAARGRARDRRSSGPRSPPRAPRRARAARGPGSCAAGSRSR